MKNQTTKITANQAANLLEKLNRIPKGAVGAHLSDHDFVAYTLATPTNHDVIFSPELQEPNDENRRDTCFIDIGTQGAILEPNDWKRIDAHLASCNQCAIEMERLLDDYAFLESAEGKQRLDAMSDRIVQHWQSKADDQSLAAKTKQAVNGLLENLRQLKEDWLAKFSANPLQFQLQTSAASDDERRRHDIFWWASKDEDFGFSVTEEKNGDLYVLFEAKQAMRFHFRLGSVQKEIELKKEDLSEAKESSEVGFFADFTIANNDRPQDARDFDIQFIE